MIFWSTQFIWTLLRSYWKKGGIIFFILSTWYTLVQWTLGFIYFLLICVATCSALQSLLRSVQNEGLCREGFLLWHTYWTRDQFRFHTNDCPNLVAFCNKQEWSIFSNPHPYKTVLCSVVKWNASFLGRSVNNHM